MHFISFQSFPFLFCCSKNSTPQVNGTACSKLRNCMQIIYIYYVFNTVFGKGVRPVIQGLWYFSRNPAIFTKICEILPNTCRYDIFDTYIGHWTCFIHLKRPNLSSVETLSLQRANIVPKLPGPHYVAKKLGTSHSVIVVERAND